MRAWRFGCRDQSMAQAQQIMSLTEQLRLAQHECSSAHNSLHVKDAELRELQSERSELAQARQVLEQELSVAQRSMTALEADLAMLQQDVLQLSTKDTRMHIDLEDSQAAAEKLREQLASTQQTARRDGAESRSQIRRLTNEKEKLESRAQLLSSRLTSMQQEYEALQRRVQQQDAENDQLQVH